MAALWVHRGLPDRCLDIAVDSALRSTTEVLRECAVASHGVLREVRREQNFTERPLYAASSLEPLCDVIGGKHGEAL